MISEVSVQCFLELARTLNFSVAADHLYMTQQAVSRQVSQLERDLGFPLFLRTRRGVTLTEAGRRFQVFFQRADTEFQQCVRECRREREKGRSVLTVGHQEGMDLRDLPTIAFWRMDAKYPGFSTVGEVYPPNILRTRLIDGKLDLILLHRSLIEDLRGLNWRVLCADLPVVLLVSRALAEKCPESRWTDYRYEPLIVEAGAFPGLEDRDVLKVYGRYGLAPQRVIVRPDLESLWLSVVAGQGVAVGGALSRIDMRLLKPYDTGYRDDLLCIWRKEEETALLRDYIDCLTDVFSHRAAPAWDSDGY